MFTEHQLQVTALQHRMQEIKRKQNEAPITIHTKDQLSFKKILCISVGLKGILFYNFLLKKLKLITNSKQKLIKSVQNIYSIKIILRGKKTVTNWLRSFHSCHIHQILYHQLSSLNEIQFPERLLNSPRASLR